MKSRFVACLLWAAASSASADGLQEHDYILNCAGCHRLSGMGSATVPSLRGIAILPPTAETRTYLIQVPGVAQAPLSNARLAALMNWVVERFDDRRPMPPYTAEEVARLRRTPLLDPLGARTRLFPSATRAR